MKKFKKEYAFLLIILFVFCIAYVVGGIHCAANIYHDIVSDETQHFNQQATK